MSFAKLSMILGSLLFSSVAVSQVELNHRCEEDNLDAAQSLGRFNWLKRCHANVLTGFHDTLFPEYAEDAADVKLQVLQDEWLFTRGRLRSRPQYLTFGTADLSNPHGWTAPIDENSPCGLPAGYVAIAICTSSCYHPSQVVLFEQGEVSIKDAFDAQFDRLVTLTDGSSLNSLSYTNRPVESYTESLRDTQHELVHVVLASGGELKVTPNHPVLNGSGVMVEAEDLKVGDSLVKDSGELDGVVSVSVEPYFGKVYNVAPQSKSLNGHIVVAQGYLSGSSWYQNEGFENVNRLILRSNVPDALLK